MKVILTLILSYFLFQQAHAVTITSETDVMAPDGTPSTRLIIGVGEIVRFDADLHVGWTATGGEPTDGGTDPTFTWFAPATPGAITIIANPQAYGDPNDPTSIQITVIAPESVELRNSVDRGGYANGFAGTGFSATGIVHPLSVSFIMTEIQEQIAPPLAFGYFSGLAHPHPAGNWRLVDGSNSGFTDEVGIRAPGYSPNLKRFSFGVWLWSIPVRYRLQGSADPGADFAQSPQLHLMFGATGAMWVGKGGSWSFRIP